MYAEEALHRHVIVTGPKQFPDGKVYFVADIIFPNPTFPMIESVVNGRNINTGDGLQVKIVNRKVVEILDHKKNVYQYINKLNFCTKAFVTGAGIKTKEETYEIQIQDEKQLYTPRNCYQDVYFKMVVNNVYNDKRVIILAIPPLKLDDREINGVPTRREQNIRARSQSRHRNGYQKPDEKSKELASPSTPLSNGVSTNSAKSAHSPTTNWRSLTTDIPPDVEVLVGLVVVKTSKKIQLWIPAEHQNIGGCNIMFYKEDLRFAQPTEVALGQFVQFHIEKSVLDSIKTGEQNFAEAFNASILTVTNYKVDVQVLAGKIVASKENITPLKVVGDKAQLEFFGFVRDPGHLFKEGVTYKWITIKKLFDENCDWEVYKVHPMENEIAAQQEHSAAVSKIEAANAWNTLTTFLSFQRDLKKTDELDIDILTKYFK